MAPPFGEPWVDTFSAVEWSGWRHADGRSQPAGVESDARDAGPDHGVHPSHRTEPPQPFLWSLPPTLNVRVRGSWLVVALVIAATVWLPAMPR